MKYSIPNELKLEFQKIANLRDIIDKHIGGNIGTKKLIRISDECTERTERAFDTVKMLYPDLKYKSMVANRTNGEWAIEEITT